MRIMLKESFEQNGFFPLQDKDWLEKQRKAGKIAACALKHLEDLVKHKTKLSLIELNDVAEKYIVDEGGTPTFKNYNGFPAAVCISVNEQLVHGIPSNYHLQDGDVVKFDLGVTVDGAIADTAITCIYGEPKNSWISKLVSSTYEALDKGIAAISVGKKLGVIGNAIYKSVKGNGFSVITKYGGHGLAWNMPHAPPFVDNRSEVDIGFRIQPGLVLAIEPMLVMGTTNTHVASDGWTVLTSGISAHAEHSVYIHHDHVEIITDRNNL
jgi:methionyl aminopeptidase